METPEPYALNEFTLEESIRKWVDGIPEEFRAPAEDTPRARILKAAAEQFAGAGFSASTTRAIAETAGVNQAMIHYYFQSKTLLYERVLGGMVIDLLSNLATSMKSRSASPIDALSGLPERIIGVFADDPVRVAIFRREIGNGAPHLRAVVDRLGSTGPRGFSRIMMEYVESARRSGAVQAESASAIFEFLLVHAYGAIFIEPMLQHLFPSGGKKDKLKTMMTSQRGIVRQALMPRPKEDEPK